MDKIFKIVAFIVLLLFIFGFIIVCLNETENEYISAFSEKYLPFN